MISCAAKWYKLRIRDKILLEMRRNLYFQISALQFSPIFTFLNYIDFKKFLAYTLLGEIIDGRLLHSIALCPPQVFVREKRSSRLSSKGQITRGHSIVKIRFYGQGTRIFRCVVNFTEAHNCRTVSATGYFCVGSLFTRAPTLNK